jgi:excisionase family DNA binding protein
LVQDRSDKQNDFDVGENNCVVCKYLLTYLERFIDVLEAARSSFASDWLTVDDISEELKISKSVVYRLIRNGQLEAVDLVDNNGKVAQKGHYRITRSSLKKFLESKRVKPLVNQAPKSSRSKRLPKVKNHLGL